MADVPIIDVAQRDDSAYGQKGTRLEYHDFTILPFPNWRSLKKFAEQIYSQKKATAAKLGEAKLGNDLFEQFVNQGLTALNNNPDAAAFSEYGLNGKQPATFKAAMDREKFVYYDEYEKIKTEIEKKVREELQKDSVAQLMKPRMIFNDMKIGEFIFAKAAMSLEPQLYLYSPSKKREVSPGELKPIGADSKMYMKDGSDVVYAYKTKARPPRTKIIEELGELTKRTKKLDGQIYYQFILKVRNDIFELQLLGYDVRIADDKLWIKKDKGPKEIKAIFIPTNSSVDANHKKIYDWLGWEGEQGLKEATSKGFLDVKSTNKEVYLYEEKVPKTHKAVNIVVGMTKGGWTSWTNDFYTGITAAVLVDILESLGYSVNVEVVVGGGRCPMCGMWLNFKGNTRSIGRRYFSFTAKSYDEQLDMDGLLYTLCDPSFHNIKWVVLYNYFAAFFGDDINTSEGDPISTWHGIEKADMINPIGMFMKHLDFKKGNNDGLLTYYIHKVVKDGTEAMQYNGDKDVKGVVEAVQDIVLDCENKNKEAAIKNFNYDFSGYDSDT